ncbi:FtsB family cell division protein [Paenibacillus dendritiformis]|uniref:FtsB family cell division protein n=1 Tax=Paenibacillus dendritiformis TaxID=130049 RepID=UPI001F552B0E|nr:septum formation initiator family protein [Paenibacillus dendritiformis]
MSASRTPDRTRENKMAGAKRRLRLWMGFMVVFAGWGLYTYIDQAATIEGLKADYKVQEKKKQDAELTRNEVQQEVDRLNTTEYILQMARSQGMLLPDEVLIRKHEE